MAADFDVPSRIAQGWPAVANLQHYVWACHQLGYQHPDLTQHAAHLGERYRTEDGMDLAALQDDWTALDDAVRGLQDALALQDRQLALLPAAWQGAGADASLDFLRRHGEAAACVVATLRSAMETLAVLRANLWHAVESKVDAAITIESRAQLQRADWLAAAETVTTGVGDRSAAAEMVDQAVKPYVDSNIRSDWLTAMRAATTAVAEAYGRAIDEISAERQPVFDVPRGLGPTWSPSPARFHDEAVGYQQDPGLLTTGPAASATTVPSGWSPPPVAAAMPATAPGNEIPAGPAAAPAASLAPPLAGMGSGLPGVGSGLSGLGQQFADMLGELLDGVGNSIPDPPDTVGPEFDDPLDLDEGEAEGDEPEGDEPEEDEEAEQDETVTEADVVPIEAVVDSAPALPPAPPPAEPLPPVDPVPAEQTPCAIAAEELPQVGDPAE